MTRPLMPRSLRSKPHPASGEKPVPRGNEKRTQGAGQVATGSGCAGGGSAGLPEVSPSTGSEAGLGLGVGLGLGRRKNGVGRATSAGPMSVTAAVSQNTSGACVVVNPAPAQERETAAAEKEPGSDVRRREARPSGRHALDAYDGTEEDAAADATDVRCLSGCAVSFRREDFVVDPHDDRGYDVVCLFSVVKWMHLNGGDEAVRNVFRKAHALLRPGGRLVLEPQVWRAPHNSQRQKMLRSLLLYEMQTRFTLAAELASMFAIAVAPQLENGV